MEVEHVVEQSANTKWALIRRPQTRLYLCSSVNVSLMKVENGENGENGSRDHREWREWK